MIQSAVKLRSGRSWRMANQTNQTQQTIEKANRHAQMVTGDSLEYKLLQIYTEKKEPTYSGPQQTNKTEEKKAASPVPSDESHKAKEKRRKLIVLRKLISCIRPQKEDNSPDSEGRRCRPSSGGDIIEFLRDQGDKLDEEVRNNHQLMQLQGILLYNTLKQLTTLFILRLSPVLCFGARYLQDYFTPWVNQQGGYGKVFSTDDEEEEVQ